MVFKKEKLYKTVVYKILQAYPDLKYNQFVSLDFKGKSLNEVVSLIDDERVKFPSQLQKVIKRNRDDIKMLFHSRTEDSDDIKYKILLFTDNFQAVAISDIRSYRLAGNDFYKNMFIFKEKK